MKKTIISVGIIVAAFVGLFFILSSNKAKNEAQTAVVSDKNEGVSVRIDTAVMREMNFEYTVNGTFAPKQEVFISTELPGKVLQVLVKEGTKVSAGQTLAVIKGEQQEVQVANAQAVLDNAQNEVNRFESAYKTGGVTKQQLEQVRLQLENARNNLQSAKLNAGNTNITASFSGIINKRMIEPGSYVNPGQQLFEVVNISTLKLKVNVDEKTVGRIQLGQTVRIESSIFTDKDWQGIISFIAPKADASLNFPVEIEVNNSDSNDLKAGMYGTVVFGDNEIVNTLVVPRIAFIGNVSSNQLFLDVEGKAKLVNVNVGRDFGDYIEVLSGIKVGDKVVTSGQINLFDDTPIVVIQ